jgi:two-component system, chemotaxis family, protein-glutamate methylesterase/glutaminase
MAPIRVLVVEDSLTVRRRLCEILRADPELQVVGEAGDGKRAIELCEQLRPDAITLDMCLPILSGLGATEHIMAHFPTPILIVSSSTNRGDLFKTYDALAAGAADVLEKPPADALEGVWERQLCTAVKRVSRIRVITHPRARLAGALSPAAAAVRPLAPAPLREPLLPASRTAPCRVVALGTSTGGPGALVDVLRVLPAPLPVPVLIVLHIGEAFAAAFAEWLQGQTPHRVRFARDGALVDEFGGCVLMAPPGRHLRVSEGKLVLTLEAERYSCRPSVDVLFESLAAEYREGVVAALLTGMGRDGAAGLLAIRLAGGRTLAQDEASSIVWGMPREAVRLGAAERVLALNEIGAALALELAQRERSGR